MPCIKKLKIAANSTALVLSEDHQFVHERSAILYINGEGWVIQGSNAQVDAKANGAWPLWGYIVSGATAGGLYYYYKKHRQSAALNQSAGVLTLPASPFPFTTLDLVFYTPQLCALLMNVLIRIH